MCKYEDVLKGMWRKIPLLLFSVLTIPSNSLLTTLLNAEFR